MKMEAHDAANIVPAMTEAEFKELKADIEKHGQRDPIIILDGKILDGRNRYRACCELGIKPDTVKFDDHLVGGDPIAYVISTNVHRRHLTPSQLSMMAITVEELYAKQAKERMYSGKKPDPMAPAPQGLARDQAAKALGVGARSVQSAKTVVKSGCDELQNAVREGKVAVKTAEKFAKAVPSPVAQAAILHGALLEDDPNAIIREHSTVKSSAQQRKEANQQRPPAARVKAAISALEDLVALLDRLGLTASLNRHVAAIREAIENERD